MARFFCNSKLISVYVVDKVSIALKSRGYAAGATTMESVSGRRNMMLRKGKEEATSSSVATTPWLPDPETGYYRPENVANEIDAVELRKLLLNHNEIG